MVIPAIHDRRFDVTVIGLHTGRALGFWIFCCWFSIELPTRRYHPTAMISPFVHLFAVLLVVGMMVLCVTSLLMAQALLWPPRMTDGKAVYVLKRLSPGDLGLHFSNVQFTVRDEATGKPLNLAAWWIPHPIDTGRCVILIHGYADAKVGSIAWAPTWQSLGYHVLAIDLRAHGESGGRNCTAGFFERHDVNQIINRLRIDHPKETREIVLFGASLGAAVALATAALREDIAAVVLESPFADYRHAVKAHVQRLGMPTGIGLQLALWMAQRISGADFDAVQPLRLLPQVKAPVLLIDGEHEELVSSEDVNLLHEAVAARGTAGDRFWTVPSATHLTALLVDPNAYANRIGQFLNALAHRSETIQARL